MCSVPAFTCLFNPLGTTCVSGVVYLIWYPKSEAIYMVKIENCFCTKSTILYGHFWTLPSSFCQFSRSSRCHEQLRLKNFADRVFIRTVLHDVGYCCGIETYTVCSHYNTICDNMNSDITRFKLGSQIFSMESVLYYGPTNFSFTQCTASWATLK